MKIAVLNPNSSKAVTQSMERCLEPLIGRTKYQIICSELPAAPIGIEDDNDVATVSPMVEAFVKASDADAFVISCFSDPGVAAARSLTDKPLFGIAESAYCTSLLYGRRFGVISLGASSIARHRVQIERHGLLGRLAGDRSIDMTVAEANDVDNARDVVQRVGAELRADGADVLILGCAGMGEQRPALQKLLGTIVIDPVQAAVSAAINALDLGYNQGK
ncbi:aspartate/glutamate racemase family protein [Martelella endophytica]|nr:aspartate/glutamate racemase family protein [Martelella endophytica]